MCIFCKPLEHKTKWYYVDKLNSIYVVRDLYDRGFDYRILVVGIGESWHYSKNTIPNEKRHDLITTVRCVSEAHQVSGNQIVFVDDDHFSIPEHFHIQVCMKRG